MKILWITNIPFPDLCKELGITSPVIGGWMYSLAKVLLLTNKDISLAVATVYNGTEFRKIRVNSITYYLLPLGKKSSQAYNKELEPYWQRVTGGFEPDIAHLHGTEYAHGLAFLNACPQVKSVASIQGLISVYERYYYGGIELKEILLNISFADIRRGNNIFQQRCSFKKRGELEHAILLKVEHVIGRTSWDKAHTLAINPNLQYHFCNETLRGAFYREKWKYDNCNKHSIFISQAGYPIKGLHQLIKALPLVLRRFPNTMVYVGGGNIVKNKSLVDKLRIGGYGLYLYRLINKLKLQDKIIFVGQLTEDEMCNYYLKSNVFVCPSSIENSPNSLGEAQLLGVPCIASYVGGSPDMMQGNENNLYRFEEIEQLAMKICNVFDDYNVANVDTMRITAQKRHNSDENIKTLLSCYNSIINNSK